MVSDDAHPLPDGSDIQAMSDAKREGLIERLLASLSATQLETVISKAQRAKREREETERKDLEARIARYKADAVRLGLEVIVRRRLSGRGSADKPKSASPAPSKERRYPAGTYRNPETGELWISGKRPPKGISEAVAAGRDPSEFLVRAGEEASPGEFPVEE